MRRGVDVVSRGTFFDTKLARKLEVAALLQMATYAER
jgi:hypothetical protein